MYTPMSDFRLSLEGDSSQVSQDPKVLRSLCQKEVSLFDNYLRRTDPQFSDGLSRFERLAVEGYIYQKARGHIDAQENPSNLPPERNDG
jgi:hypothetical protein